MIFWWIKWILLSYNIIILYYPIILYYILQDILLLYTKYLVDICFFRWIILQILLIYEYHNSRETNRWTVSYKHL